MEVHRPKPLHGLREFLKEIGIIVIGVLIALGAEQAVEALHHRGQADEMQRKLRQEGVENRHVVVWDLAACRGLQAELDRDIQAIGAALKAGRLPAAPEPLHPRPRYQIPDAAWVTIRDSALLPIMPKLIIDNHWRLDATRDAMQSATASASARVSAVRALIASAQERPMDEALAKDLLLALEQSRDAEANYCRLVAEFGRENELALKGQVIDIEFETPPAGADARPVQP